MNESHANIPDDYLNLLPAYEQIKVALVRQIESEEFRPGDRVPSENELCRMFNVSRTTVTRALNDLAQAGVLVRRQGLGTFVADRAAERSPQEPGTAPAISVLVRHLSTPFVLRVVEGVEAELSAAGYKLVLYNSHRSQAREAALLEEIAQNDTRGLIVRPLALPDNGAAYRAFLESGKPLAFVDHGVEGVDCDLVTEDNEQGAYELTTYLLSQGHRDIAFVPSLDAHASTTKDRYEGYCRAHIEQDIPVREALVLAEGCEPPMPLEALAAILDPLFGAEPPPGAVVCVNDSVAAAVDFYLHHRPTKSAGMAFFDAYDPYYWTKPPLARIIQFPKKMGAAAAKLMLERLEQPGSTYKPTRISLPQQLSRGGEAPPMWQVHAR